MNTPLDHLSALIAGAVVLLMLSSVDRRGQTDSIQAVEYYALNTQSLSYSEVIRRDLESLSSPLSINSSAGSFQFRARLTPHDSTSNLVTYEQSLAETRDGVPLYRVRRIVDGDTTGGSPGLLEEWSVQGQTAAGTAAATTDEIVQFRVVFEMVASRTVNSNNGVDGIPNRKRWEATIAPSLLNFRAL